MTKYCKKKCKHRSDPECRQAFVDKKQCELINHLMMGTFMIMNWSKIRKFERDNCKFYKYKNAYM